MHLGGFASGELGVRLSLDFNVVTFWMGLVGSMNL